MSNNYIDTKLRIYESYENGYITESEKYGLIDILESNDEGKLRYSKSKDNIGYGKNVDNTKIAIVRMTDSLDKKLKNGTITKKEYNTQIDKLDRVAKRHDPTFDYVKNSDHGKAFDKIPDNRKEPNRHDRVRSGAGTKSNIPKYSRDDEQKHTYTASKPKEIDRAKRLAKRILSSDNMSGVNKKSEGEHKTAFNQLTKQAGVSNENPIRIDRYKVDGKEKISVTDRTSSSPLANKKVKDSGELYRVSPSENTSYARPSNKSSDSIVYPSSRIYYAKSGKVASTSAPTGKRQVMYKRDSSNKNNDIHYDPEIPTNDAVYVKTRNKEKVSKDTDEAKKVNEINKKETSGILNDFYSMLNGMKK